VRFSETKPHFETHIERNLDPADVEELLKPYLKRPWEDSDRDFRWLAHHDEELLEKYPNEFVAVFDCKVVAHSPDSKEFWEQLEKAGVRDKAPVVHFFFGPEVTLIL
jgi:hypothetical protein